MKRSLAIAATVLGVLVVAAASAHAATPLPHGPADCLTCGLCEWLHTLLT